jgi:hypothetical protein
MLQQISTNCLKVVVRAKDNSWYFGELNAVYGTHIELSNSRQLIEWVIDYGIGMSGLANHGLSMSDKKQSFLSETVTKSYVFDVAEIIACNDTAAQSIEQYKSTDFSEYLGSRSSDLEGTVE